MAATTSRSVEQARAGHQLFFWFTAVFWVACLALGVVLGLEKGTGLGIGDTVVLHVRTPPAVSSFFGAGWRIVGSLAVLGALPAAWYAFLKVLGGFSRSSRTVDVPGAVSQRDSLIEDEVNFPTASVAARKLSVFSIFVLLTFGNFFLPYVIVRFGWGGAS